MTVNLTNNQAFIAGVSLLACALQISAGLIPAACVLSTIFALAGLHFYVFSHEIKRNAHPFGEYGIAYDNRHPISKYQSNLKMIIALAMIITIISQFMWWKLVSEEAGGATAHEWIFTNVFGLLAFMITRRDAPPLIDFCAAAISQMIIVSACALSIGIYQYFL